MAATIGRHRHIQCELFKITGELGVRSAVNNLPGILKAQGLISSIKTLTQIVERQCDRG